MNDLKPRIELIGFLWFLDRERSNSAEIIDRSFESVLDTSILDNGETDIENRDMITGTQLHELFEFPSSVPSLKTI